MGFFDKLKRAFSGEEKEQRSEETEKYDKGLEKSRKTFGDKLNELFANFRTVDEDFFDNLEETLIEADVGFDTAVRISDELNKRLSSRTLNLKLTFHVQLLKNSSTSMRKKDQVRTKNFILQKMG
ncbi:signal recognition particle receptor protein FtsY [Liquorilactobacillus sucicola DSM 21376 = JCM 15457]|nr:signal recognition particle receptor protein FtsY [Liquorilactobacillus sucicola DSM 21376 = JCM 15457]